MTTNKKETKTTTKNSNLHDAKKNKNDEFYTQLVDIEKELRHYTEHFRDKIVFCNCDDPYESNFFQYFAMNFKYLGLKKLIAMGYNTSPVAMTQLSLLDVENVEEPKKKAYKIEILDVIDENNDGAIDMTDIKLLAKKNKDKIKIRTLRGDGDFKSNESVKCLMESDIVVTNPPFSLFREYVAQLMFYEKKFLILWNMNAITYKEFFPLIKENKVWSGYKTIGSDMFFIISEKYWEELKITKKEWSAYRIFDGKVFGRVATAMWFTNLEHSKRNEEIDLYKKYKSEEYPKYDNYDAIEVSKVNEIPKDYDGAMWVPITFLGKFNPEQFEILGLANDKREINPAFIQWRETYLDEGHKRFVGMVLNENWRKRATYARILIKNKKPQK